MARRRGRKAERAHTAIGLFIQKRLEELKITQTELAKRLEVNRSTISRLLSGSVQFVQCIDSESLCDALELNETDRHTFHLLHATNRHASLEQVETGARVGFAFSVNAPNILKYKTKLDLAEDHARLLERILTEGDKPDEVMKSASLWYKQLTEESPSTKDPHLAEVQIRFGLILGNAQALALPLDQRANHAIPTFNTVNIILNRFPINTVFPQEYALLLAHRGVHYRGLGYIQQSDDDYAFGMDLAERAGDSLLFATLRRLYAHNYAVIGDEYEWQRRIEEAERAVISLPFKYRPGAIAHLDYVRAGGYRRLAFNSRLNLSKAKRIAYAQKALTSAAQSYKAIEQNPESSRLLLQTVDERNPQAHLLTAQVADAQCLIFTAPEETMRRIEHLQSEVIRFYPSLLPRLRDTYFIAQGQLQKHKMNPLQLFKTDQYDR